jgi:hypothetical protein
MGALRVSSRLVDSLLATQEGSLRTLSDMEKELEAVRHELANKTVAAQHRVDPRGS